MSDPNKKIILELKNKLEHQQRVIIILREFFTSNSEFVKLYRKNSPELYPEMEDLLYKQETIFKKLESTISI